MKASVWHSEFLLLGRSESFICASVFRVYFMKTSLCVLLNFSYSNPSPLCFTVYCVYFMKPSVCSFEFLLFTHSPFCVSKCFVCSSWTLPCALSNSSSKCSVCISRSLPCVLANSTYLHTVRFCASKCFLCISWTLPRALSNPSCFALCFMNPSVRPSLCLPPVFFQIPAANVLIRTYGS